MDIKSIDKVVLRRMFLVGAKELESKKELINELNVFPVPDGDTGTNMTLTIMSAAKEVASIPDEELSFKTLCKAISSGSLRGARGNSGVILSQLFRGFTKIIKPLEEIDTNILADACVKATETAYKAVMVPKEGTILTVAKAMSDEAVEVAKTTDNLVVMIESILKAGQEALEHTPELLPVLKEAGVVDSGGQGLVAVVTGCYDALLGKEVDFFEEEEEEKKEEESKFTYASDYKILPFVDFNAVDEKTLTTFLDTIGDSVKVEKQGDGVCVHVQTNDPGAVLTKLISFGNLSQVSIENKKPQDSIHVESPVLVEKTEEDLPKKEKGFISVSVGDGIKSIFESLGVDYIIEGGQTMNPSTEDMLLAIAKVNADTIYILPNNKNIILAANQARDLTKDKTIVVVPSKNVPQGIAAMISFSPENSTEENLEAMTEGMTAVKTGQVTYSVRDTNIDGHEIHQGDIMGIGDQGILAVGQDVDDTALKMVQAMVDENSELVSVYFGLDVMEETANEFVKKIAEEFPDLDVEINYGGQPIYYYMISVE